MKIFFRFRSLLAALSTAAVILPTFFLMACSSPPQPDWKANAKDALDRASAAYLKGDTRTATQEFGFARAEVARTGRPDLLARVALTECALHIASVDFSSCQDFDRLRQDASEAERAYADYLSGQLATPAIVLLPVQHRTVAGAQDERAAAAALKEISDPVAQLVAAGVLLRTHRASPSVLAIATSTASSQGWQRPLLAWLGVQKQLAEQRGDQAQQQHLQRRIELIESVNPPSPGQAAGKL